MKWLVAIVASLLLGLGAIIALHERPSAGSHGKSSTISRGQTIDLNDHLADGTWTIIEFTADW